MSGAHPDHGVEAVQSGNDPRVEHRIEIAGNCPCPFGVTACVAFRASLPFKAAAVCVASTALLGDAVGHVHQMMIAGNFAAGNAGVPFWTDVIVMMLAIVLLAVAWRQHEDVL
ncbi:DUF6790 family protein [Acidisphaera sp. S103]|uniref:DUF6790 family protein n=1 Tax=Acidisphaera sp. S103 TaxID=1747223 RepID=UPI00131B31AD|nr:DUF6790 family protein [Acidisphaera sp. S103]